MTNMGSKKKFQEEKNLYAINLLLKPVEDGITMRTRNGVRHFSGLGAFNHYFGLLLPQDNCGYTVADVWDGHFHITLAKFKSNAPLEKLFHNYSPWVDSIPSVVDPLFRSSHLATFPGEDRFEEGADIDFVVLQIDSDEPTEEFYHNIQPLLVDLRDRAKAFAWNVTKLDQLHVTIRKYSQVNVNLKMVPIGRYPIEFRCSRLEIRPLRRVARALYNQENQRGNAQQWWEGVTEINRECSGCNTPVTSGWPGFCIDCGQYETMRPIWSTTGGQ